MQTPSRKTIWLVALFLLPCAASAEKNSRLDVILIAFDPLRADRLRPYGYAGDPMPALSSFSASALVYERAVSPASWTLPAAVSVFTGLYPGRHGLSNAQAISHDGTSSPAELATSTLTLPQIFKASGYDTAGFTGGAPFVPEGPLARGFGHFQSGQPFSGAAGAFAAARDWLKTRRRDRPFFLFVHGYDPHSRNYVRRKVNTAASINPAYRKLFKKMEAVDSGKTDAPDFNEPERQLLISTYDERLSTADTAFGDFIGLLKKDGLLSGAVVVVYSHHGEGLFDHGIPGHGRNLYGELVRVPLLIHVPGKPGGRRPELVSLLGLGPTLLAIAGVTPPPSFSPEAPVLPPFSPGAWGCRDVFSETDFLLRASQRAVTACDGWKLIYDQFSSKRELYDLNSDPGERNDLFQAEPEKAAELEQKLLDWEIR